MDASRRKVLAGAGAAGGIGVLGAVGLTRGSGPEASRSADWGGQSEPEPLEDYDTIIVDADGDGDHETVQGAVDAADDGTLILVQPGVYYEEVEVEDTERLTIRGTDRDEVILDGDDYEYYNAFTITADDVVVENLTVREYEVNGVYWVGVEGYRASHVIAHHVAHYAIYAFDSRYGRFEHCYTSGSDDAGFYIGQSQPADAVITDCVAEYNGMGYSGTNAGGNLVIKDSVWRHNVTGIVPNTLDSQEGAPQGHDVGGIRIENNEIYDNNNLDAPAIANAYAAFGNGITVAGGRKNDIVDNYIHDQEKYGIAVTPMLSDNFYRPSGNAVERNTLEDCGRADLALSAPARDNRFADNDFDTSRPAFIERRNGSFGDIWIFLQMVKDFYQTDIGSYPSGDVADQPDPSEETLTDLERMEDPEGAPPRYAVGEV